MKYCKKIIHSPLWDVFLIASDTHLLLLDFHDSQELSKKIKKVTNEKVLIERKNTILEKVEKELCEYFSGIRKDFTIPLSFSGTIFQEWAWKALQQIPYGETRNYLEQATMLGNPKAVRAIGGANHHNPIAIIIPCHRVIGKSGKLVGYAGGVERKKWLLEYEKSL